MPATSNTVTEPGGAKKTPDRRKSNRDTEDLRMTPNARPHRPPALIPAPPAVIPAPSSVIPAKAGTQGPVAHSAALGLHSGDDHPDGNAHCTREIAFIDPGVVDIATLLGHLRPEVEPILLDPVRPAARQIAGALAAECQLAAVHIIAHGAPGRVDFTAGDWSTETLAENAEDLAEIGAALAISADLRLWSCQTAAGPAGAAFIAGLAQASGAGIAAATGLVGAAALRGRWELTAAAQPPLTATGLASYAGIFAVSEVIVEGTLPEGNTTRAVTYFIIDAVTRTIVGQVVLPNAANENYSVAVTVKVPAASASYAIGTFDINGDFQPCSFLRVDNPARDRDPGRGFGGPTR